MRGGWSLSNVRGSIAISSSKREAVAAVPFSARHDESSKHFEQKERNTNDRDHWK